MNIERREITVKDLFDGFKDNADAGGVAYGGSGKDRIGRSKNFSREIRKIIRAMKFDIKDGEAQK